MTRLLTILFLLGAMLTVPAVAFAQDDDPTTITTGAEGDPTLPPDVENPETAVTATSDFDAATALEWWHMLSVALPVLIGHVGNRLPKRWRKADHMAQLAGATYLVYAVIGEALKGTFDTLSWNTPQLVAASLVKIAGISYASYKITSNAFPKVVGGKPGPTA